jgi:N,N'-diacetyllegionaminate synthase
MATLIIAEAGVNHNGDVDIAKKLVHAAAEAGADMIKFQSFQANKIASVHASKADYQKAATGRDGNQLDMIAKLELSRASHDLLVDECKKVGIRFFSTGFDEDSLDMLVELGLELIKVPSGEITNLPLLRHIAAKGMPVIMSTGMADMADIEAAIAALEAGGIPRTMITVLHCNTEYPTPMQDVNLPAMRNIAAAFGVKMGYSDHTQGIEVPVAAVALGATVIEKHLTLDRNLPGPDHCASLEPIEFKRMVDAIRNIELALAGDGIKRPSPSEIKNRAIARKSIVAACDIAAGEILDASNLTSKRPGNGISPMRWDDVVGRRAPRLFVADELIEL